MNIDLTYKLTGTKGETIDFSSKFARSEGDLNQFILKMYRASPSFTDRRGTQSKENHQIELSKLFDVIYFVKELYGFDALKIFFDYQNNNNQLEISILNFGKKVIRRTIAKPIFFNQVGNTIEFRATYNLVIKLTYEYILDYFKNLNLSNLSKKSRSVAICIAKNNKPVSRSEILKQINCSPRTASNAFNELEKRGIVKRINHTKSPKLNRYILN